MAKQTKEDLSGEIINLERAWDIMRIATLATLKRLDHNSKSYKILAKALDKSAMIVTNIDLGRIRG